MSSNFAAEEDSFIEQEDIMDGNHFLSRVAAILQQEAITQPDDTKDREYFMSKIVALFQEAAPYMTAEQEEELFRLRLSILESSKHEIRDMTYQFLAILDQEETRTAFNIREFEDYITDAIEDIEPIENYVAVISELAIYKRESQLKELNMKLRMGYVEFKKNEVQHSYDAELEKLAQSIELLKMEEHKMGVMHSIKNAKLNVFIQ